jgi:hypothetical protein
MPRVCVPDAVSRFVECHTLVLAGRDVVATAAVCLLMIAVTA